jgi:hypothetical protein
MVNIHCAIPKFTHSLASRRVWLLPALRPASCPDNSHHVPSGPSLRKHYPSFFALTTTCASPKASPQLRLVGSLVSLCSLDHPLLLSRTFPTFRLANPSLDAWTFTPAASGVHLLVSSSRASAFPKTVAGRRLAVSAQRLPCGTVFRSCSHSFMFRPLGLLATQVVPTDATCTHGGPDVYFRAPYGSLLSHTSDMLAVRFRAIDGRGLSPHKIRGVVGRIHRFNGFRCCENNKPLKRFRTFLDRPPG